MCRSLLFIIAASTATAGTIEDHLPDSRYVQYAVGFAPYTSRLRATAGDRTVAVGSATLIADRWALTAAHVVHGAQEVEVAGKKASLVVMHEGWTEDSYGKCDIALVRVDDSFALDFYPPLSDGDEKPGDTVSVAGFGVTGRMSSGYTTNDEALRAGTQTIERFDNDLIVCEAKRRSSPLELCIAPGDSGGPLFARGRLAGINSMTQAARGPLRSRYGEETCHTRVSLFREWISHVMERHK